MSRKNNDNKLRVSALKIIVIFTVLFLVMDAIFYVSFQYENFWPLEMSFYIYTPVLFVTSAVFCYISITSTYYLVDKHKLTHSKMGQIKEYAWKDIIYVDEEWSLRHKMMRFYTIDGKERYLVFDKKGLIYEYALNYGRLLSEEEFLARFPKAKL